MIQIVKCDECGGESIAMDAVSVNVELHKSHFCDKCYNSKTESQRYFFCSEKCFQIYIRKVVDGEAEFKFDR